jgi:hypothetical protein
VSLIRCGAIVLRCKVVQTTGFAPDSWRLTPSWASLREDKLAQLRGHPDPLQLHTELLQAMTGIPHLASEHALLAATAPARTLQVPAGSTTGTEDWRVYEVAVRSAAVWWAAQSHPQPMTAKVLAGKSMRDTKYTWTPARRQAFANLTGPAPGQRAPLPPWSAPGRATKRGPLPGSGWAARCGNAAGDRARCPSSGAEPEDPGAMRPSA